MTQWIGAITRGHNGGAVLLKDGEIVGKLTTDAYEYEGVDPRSVGKDCGWSDQMKGDSDNG